MSKKPTEKKIMDQKLKRPPRSTRSTMNTAICRLRTQILFSFVILISIKLFLSIIADTDVHKVNNLLINTYVPHCDNRTCISHHELHDAEREKMKNFKRYLAIERDRSLRLKEQLEAERQANAGLHQLIGSLRFQLSMSIPNVNHLNFEV